MHDGLLFSSDWHSKHILSLICLNWTFFDLASKFSGSGLILSDVYIKFLPSADTPLLP